MGAVDAWFDTVQTAPMLHWANIALGGTLLGSDAVTGVHRFGGETSRGLQTAIKSSLALLTLGTSALFDNFVAGAMDKLAETMNAALDETKDPNIEGIPIHGVKESGSKDVEVGKQLVIVQSSNAKDYVVDNAVPQLKQWQLNGYLTALPYGLDPYLIIKPGLKVQQWLLEQYADSRKPVWFKSHDGTFHLVLISHFDYAYDAQYLNGLAVNITLTEFKVMKTEKTTASAVFGKLKDSSSSNTNIAVLF